MNMKKNKKSQVTLYIFFFVFAIVIITITAVLAPMAVRFNTEMYKAGEFLILQSNQSISEINNATIRNTLQTSFGDALGATTTNIETNNALFKYGWIILLVITAIFLMLAARSIIETGRSQGGFI